VTKQATRNPESYFLAGRSLPWWVSGRAHGSSGIDIGGTLWFVTMRYIYRAKGLFLLWIWPLFNVGFRMVCLGTCVRRSNVLKWHGWRSNGHGLWAGMAAGTVEALVIPPCSRACKMSRCSSRSSS
jgi:hypothetical protein